MEERELKNGKIIYMKLMEMVGVGKNGWDVELSEVMKVVGKN